MRSTLGCDTNARTERFFRSRSQERRDINTANGACLHSCRSANHRTFAARSPSLGAISPSPTGIRNPLSVTLAPGPAIQIPNLPPQRRQIPRPPSLIPAAPAPSKTLSNTDSPPIRSSSPGKTQPTSTGSSTAISITSAHRSRRTRPRPRDGCRQMAPRPHRPHRNPALRRSHRPRRGILQRPAHARPGVRPKRSNASPTAAPSTLSIAWNPATPEPTRAPSAFSSSSSAIATNRLRPPAATKNEICKNEPSASLDDPTPTTGYLNAPDPALTTPPTANASLRRSP